jgi:acyl carrier protein
MKEQNSGLEQQIVGLIEKALPRRRRRPAITAATRLQEDLGLDSIALLALVFQVREITGVDLAAVAEGSAPPRFQTVGDVLDAIASSTMG